LARKFARANIIEIGSRNGDGISCFAQTAKQATAIEADRSYCDFLRRRSASLPNNARFQVVCSFFDGQAGKPSTETLKEADFVTWWMNGAYDRELLRTLQKLAELGAVPKTTQAVILFDMHLQVDRRSFASLLRIAAWNTSVNFDECALCRARTKARSKDPLAVWESCNRAVGTFCAVGIELGTLTKTNLARAVPLIKANWDIRLARPFEERNRCAAMSEHV